MKNIFTLLKSLFVALRLKYKYKENKREKKYIFVPAETKIFSELLRVLPIYLSIYKAGYEIIVYLSLRSIKSLIIYFLLGVNKFYFVSSISLKENKIDNKYSDIDFEKYSKASLKRIYKTVDQNKIKNYKTLVKNNVNKMKKLIFNFKDINFDKVYAVFFTDIIYNPQGPMYEFLKYYKPKIKIFAYTYGNTSSTLVINNFSKNLRHPWSPPLEYFKEIRRKISLKEMKKLHSSIQNKLFSYYKKADWMCSVGTSSYINGSNNSTISKNFLSRSEGALFIIFPHIYWDASSESGIDLFGNYQKWFENTVRFLLEKTNSNIIIKDHPANLAKYASDSQTYISVIKSFLEKYEARFENRTLYLKPDTHFSSLDLINLSDYVLTVRGTTGVEASLLGKKVIFAGTGRYDGFGFGDFPKSKKEYFKILDLASKMEVGFKKEEKYNASIYLDLLWNKMTFSNQIIKTKYQNKAKSIPKVTLKTSDFFKIDKSLKRLSNWLSNPTEFYLN